MRVRDGIDPLRCTVSGKGTHFYQAGENQLNVAAVDCEGDTVESIEPGDVNVSVCGEGASVTHVAVSEAGIVEVVYCVPVGSVAPVTLGLSVCGAVMPGSPWTVTCPLGDSAILDTVAPERLAAFQH